MTMQQRGEDYMWNNFAGESCGKNAVVLYGYLGNNLFLFGKSCRNPEARLKREHHCLDPLQTEVYKHCPPQAFVRNSTCLIGSLPF